VDWQIGYISKTVGKNMATGTHERLSMKVKNGINAQNCALGSLVLTVNSLRMAHECLKPIAKNKKEGTPTMTNTEFAKNCVILTHFKVPARCLTPAQVSTALSGVDE